MRYLLFAVVTALGAYLKARRAFSNEISHVLGEIDYKLYVWSRFTSSIAASEEIDHAFTVRIHPFGNDVFSSL